MPYARVCGSPVRRWCGPCRFIAPEFEKLAKEFGHAVAFLKVDIDEMSRLASKHSINVSTWSAAACGVPWPAHGRPRAPIAPRVTRAGPSTAPRPQAVPTFLCFIGGEQLPGELVGADMAGLRAAAEQLAASAEGESDSD